MTRLTSATLATLPPSVRRPAHPATGPIGIVHFGPGAFHRAHQAAYVDTVLDHDPRWGIAAVSMRSRGTVDALAAQDGLYTLAIRDTEPSLRIIAAHRAFLATPGDSDAVRRLLAAPAVELVTTTVTEKGYCLAADGTLDLSHPDIRYDLGQPSCPASVIGWIVEGLAARRAAGVAAFVPLACDNLADNGRKLHAALVAFAARIDPNLSAWIADTVRAPRTMVDAITPASDAALLGDVATGLGVEDRAAVQREAFAQWVIEDPGEPLGPDLAAAGAIVTADVAGYERAKLRILNGAHSTLAYAGLLRGHHSVADAMRDDALARFVAAMIADEIAPTLPRVAGLDLSAYAEAVLARFRNAAIVHRLDQIAHDGSQKLPYRLGDTLLAARRAGYMPGRVVAAIACWVAFVIARARSGTAIVDPAAGELVALATEGMPDEVVDRFAARRIGLPHPLDDQTLAVLRDAAVAAHRGDWATLLCPS